MKTGDVVFHRPSEEEWVVGWADHKSGYMAPCGYPTCRARIDDCDVIRESSEQECWDLALQFSRSGRSDANYALAFLPPRKSNEERDSE